jgi:hypothetical protein
LKKTRELMNGMQLDSSAWEENSIGFANGNCYGIYSEG